MKKPLDLLINYNVEPDKENKDNFIYNYVLYCSVGDVVPDFIESHKISLYDHSALLKHCLKRAMYYLQSNENDYSYIYYRDFCLDHKFI